MFTTQNGMAPVAVAPVPQGGALVLGDVTIVQNHTFGQPNPMMQQMQMMQMQQLQQQNQVLALGMRMAGEAVKSLMNNALVNEALEYSGNNKPETLKIANVIDVDVRDAEVEYEVKEESDDSFLASINKKREARFNEVIEDEKPSYSLVPKHMKKLFNHDGSINRENVKYNTFIKVEEDSHTYALFVIYDKNNPLKWRDVFKTEYSKQNNAVFKTSSGITDKDSKFMIIVEDGFEKHLISIVRGDTIPKDFPNLLKEYVRDTTAFFNSKSVWAEPYVGNGKCLNMSDSTPETYCIVYYDCLFSTGKYCINTRQLHDMRRVV